MDFRTRRLVARVVYSKPTLAVLAVLLVVVLGAVWNMLASYRDARDARDDAHARYDALKQRRGELAGEVAHLKTPRGREEKIREDFGFKKEGETVITIIEEDPPAPAGRNEGGAASIWHAFWQSIKAVFSP